MSPVLSFDDPWGLLSIALALALGGLIKGITGAGAPIVAIPIIAAVFDIKVAVAVMVVPNFFSNVWQSFKYRAHAVEKGFARNFGISGAIGAGIGTIMLAYLSTDLLAVVVVLIVFAYIALRLFAPELRLPLEQARRGLWPAGIIAGALQGAVGVSAPASLTFLNSMQLPRSSFIFTLSVFFAAMCVVQIPMLIYYGLLTVDVAILGALSIVPLIITIPIGEWIGTKLNPVVFDKAILILLFALAVRLLWQTFN